MPAFLSAHGYDPGPTQRPLLAGAISGVLGTIPALILLQAFGSLEVQAKILGVSVLATILFGLPVMAAAGAAYARLFGRAANSRHGGWLFAMAFGFVLWTAGAVMILPLASGGMAPAGQPALGVFLSMVVWGAALGTILPFVHRALHKTIEAGAKLPSVGPASAARPGRSEAA